MAVTFYFTRHGETQFNVENRIQGWCDSPLTSKGVYDAYRLGVGLADTDFVGACSSDAMRARETLSIALESRRNERMRRHAADPASPLGAAVPMRDDERLREWCFGDLEGEPSRRMRNRLFDLFGDDLSREEQNRRLDEIADYLADTDPAHRAEDFATITGRIQAFLDDCGRSVEKRGGGNVLVVSHALLIRTLVFLYARERSAFPAKIENASITRVTWDNGKISMGPIGSTRHLGASL